MLFIDSANLSEITECFGMGIVKGVNTDPILLNQSGGMVPPTMPELEARIIAISRISSGPIFVQLTAETELEMMEQARVYDRWVPKRVVVSVPFSELGLVVSHRIKLEGKHIQVNMASVMTSLQAIAACNAGANFVSMMFAGVRWSGEFNLARRLLSNKGCYVLATSITDSLGVNSAFDSGANAVAVPYQILKAMLHDPKTEILNDTFRRATNAPRGLACPHATGPQGDPGPTGPR